MPFDEILADRVRDALASPGTLKEKKMFGGLAFLLDGNMCCGVHRDNLMLRLGVAGAEAALTEPGVEPMNFTGRPMRGWVTIPVTELASDVDLAEWVRKAERFAGSLPKK